MLKVEKMLGLERRENFEDRNKMMNYCCNLTIKLGNIYIHKTRSSF